MKKIITFFHSKKIVYSKTHAPAQFCKAIEIRGKKYIRVVQTNKQNKNKSYPMYDIPIQHIIGIRFINSPFKLWLMRILRIKPNKEIALYKVLK